MSQIKKTAMRKTMTALSFLLALTAVIGTAHLIHSISLSMITNSAKRVIATVPTQPVPSQEEINFKSLQISCERKECTLKLAVIKSETCQLGDFDAIEADLTKTSDDQIALLSLEPLGESDFSPLAISVTLDQIRRGFSYKFQFPKPTSPVQLGLFICKDAKKENRCITKKYTEIDRLFFDATERSSFEQGYRSPDRIYFFQYLLLEHDSVSVFTSSTPDGLSEDIFKARTRFVGSRYPTGKRKAASELILAQNITLVLRSLPLKFFNSAVYVILPKYRGRKECPAHPMWEQYKKDMKKKGIDI